VNNLREIQALRRLSPHEHIITLHEILYDKPTGRLVLVFELMDCNLYEHIKGLLLYLSILLATCQLFSGKVHCFPVNKDIVRIQHRIRSKCNIKMLSIIKQGETNT
ncbi:hypothetical protein ABPG74_022937, partial [Tetrahymena malaccensis]